MKTRAVVEQSHANQLVFDTLSETRVTKHQKKATPKRLLAMLGYTFGAAGNFCLPWIKCCGGRAADFYPLLCTPTDSFQM